MYFMFFKHTILLYRTLILFIYSIWYLHIIQVENLKSFQQVVSTNIVKSDIIFMNIYNKPCPYFDVNNVILKRYLQSTSSPLLLDNTILKAS